MRGDHWTPGGESDGADEIRFGAKRSEPRPLPGWLSRLCSRRPLIAASAVLASGVLTSLIVTVTTAGHGSTLPRRSPARVTEPHLPRLGIQGTWELDGYGPGWLVRIQFGTGRVIKTAVPDLASGGPVAFVVGPHQAVIRPLDFVPGYLVQDGRPARQLTGALADGGAVIPGPRPGTAWVQAGYQAATVPLVRLDGHGTVTGMVLRLPPGGSTLLLPDGQGYALDTAGPAGGLYDVRPGGIRRIDGTLIAVGPTELLTLACRSARRCSNIIEDPATGTRHVLLTRPTAAETDAVPGVIAPDGSAAAMIQVGRGGRLTLHLVSLESGADQRIPVPLDQGSADRQTLAWSPDGRWLFAVAANGELASLDTRTGHVALLGADLPAISQVAVRN